jgi:hypothetical protein
MGTLKARVGGVWEDVLPGASQAATYQVTPATRVWSTVGGAATTVAASNGWAYHLPVFCPPCAIDGIGCEVTTAGAAGSVTRIGIYANHPTRVEPYSVFKDAGTVVSDSTGWKSITFAAIAWPGGWMWLTIAAQGTGAPSYRAVTGHAEPWVGFAIDQVPPNLTYRGWSTSIGGAGLPATIVPGLSAAGNPKISFHAP